MKIPAHTKIVIHRGADRPGRYIWSPFVTKVEFRHRLAELPYSCGAGGPRNGPKGKIPWVEVSIPGQEPDTLADSSLITKDLVAKGLADDLNAHLTVQEKAQDLAIRAMLEDKLFFYNARERWVDNFYTMRDYSMAQLPFPQRYIFGYMAYRAILRTLHGQGTGRLSAEEVHSFRKEIWESVNAILEESRRRAAPSECFWVLGGKKPTEADTTVFGFIISSLVATAGPVNKQLVKEECPAAVEYARRIHERYFPDYEMWD
ncbi:thioredoxin-like fold-containing protein [Parastagonospora nodorum]|nr:thioredoxin-like fold-containing protein [Parastagonospora nodorum]KAH5247612.1 thioredoxin-like fold-containing protein [Parastagonospora nodorum]KAH5415671.1 thioredoxin-like fold-containing protein [Parastagonospora nodorum]KAH5657718.1 thioredoxin-like fold-containing protein [Parastagonospora nodorum]